MNKLKKERTFKEFENELRKNKDFEKEWAKPDASEILMLRIDKGLTQKQLAEKVGTYQSAISRLENNPDEATLDFVGKVAYALGYRAELKFKKL